MILLRSLITILALLLGVLLEVARSDDTPGGGEIIEPPFPSIFKTSMKDNRKIKIVSEIIDDDIGYQTSEEYADFQAGKAAFLVSSHDKGQEVVFSETHSASIFKYRPYRCEKFKPADKIFDNLNDHSVHYETHNYNEAMLNQHDTIYLRVFGVAGMWISAEHEPKKYSRSDLIFSTSKDIYRPSHNWEFQEKGLSITFHFIDANFNSKTKKENSQGEKSDNSLPPELSLEMIQIRSLETNKIIRTINVMLIDYWLQDDVSNKFLQVPVGYGCMADESQQQIEEHLDEGTSWYGFQLEHGRAELEITETRILTDKGSKKKSRATKTVNVELAHTQLNGYPLTLVRVKNNNQDIRSIYSYEFKTKYRVDMRKSQCEMSHMKELKEELHSSDPDRVVKFSDESGLSLDWNMIDLLFADRAGFKLVKKTEANERELSHIYLEKEFLQWPYNLDGSPASEKHWDDLPLVRVIRNFVASSNLEVLESITVWFFDRRQTEIIRSYHINLIDYQEIDTFLDVPRVFDVSDECFLNNALYKSGKQYAWFELFYPTTSRINDLIGQDEIRFKDMVYKQILSTPGLHLTSFRVPKMEFMFDDEGLIIRCLVLDRPPMELIYDQVNMARLTKIDESSGDSTQVEPDVSHCAKLCHLHSCKTMTFCQYDRKCSLKLEKAASKDIQKNAFGCQTYLLPEFDRHVDDDELLRRLHDTSLHQILSKLQHQDYGVVPLPKAPDEALMPQSESGLDDEAYHKLMNDYTKELNRFLAEDAHRVPELSLIIMINSHLFVLLASKFTIEDDPLNKFDLIDREAENSLDYGENLNDDDDDDQQGPTSGAYFHDGLSISRFKLTSFMAGPERAKQFDGLSYDQCALACLDNKCGSFSYCPNRRECTITSVNNTKTALGGNLIEQDFDCFISQRDFLRNFKRFDNVYSPQLYKRQSSDMVNPSDCALECVSANDFKCLSFEYCKASKSCYYQDSRHPAGIYDTTASSSSKTAASPSSATPPPATGCDHYERSLLADFNQIEYRQIEPTQLARMATTTIEGKSIFQCADICANQLADCSAFQFCFYHKSGFGQLRPQECKMIQSKPAAGANDDQDFAVVVGDDAQVVKAGKYIVKSEQCHLFSLRQDTGEAHLRDLALPNALSLQESRELEAKRAESSRGLSLMGGFALFIGVCLVSTGLGFTVSVASERSHFVRQRIERARLLLGV